MPVRKRDGFGGGIDIVLTFENNPVNSAEGVRAGGVRIIKFERGAADELNPVLIQHDHIEKFAVLDSADCATLPARVLNRLPVGKTVIGEMQRIIRRIDGRTRIKLLMNG